MSHALPVPAAARELGIAEVTLWRWIGSGAPVARRGRRGKGCRTLIDPRAVQSWRRGGEGDYQDRLLILAAELPEVLAAGIFEAFTLTESSHKRELAGIFAATWLVCATHIAEHLRRDCPQVRDPAELPRLINQLREINGRPARTGSRSTETEPEEKPWT